MKIWKAAVEKHLSLLEEEKLPKVREYPVLSEKFTIIWRTSAKKYHEPKIVFSMYRKSMFFTVNKDFLL